MIFRLIQRDPAWRMMPYLTGAMAIACAVQAATKGSRNVLVILWTVYLTFFMQVRTQQRATFFEAALPILARDLLRARLLAILAMIWLPALAGMAALLTSDVVDAQALMAGASAFTLALAFTQSGRMQDFSSPFGRMLGGMIVAGLSLVAALVWERPLTLSAVSLLLAGALFARTWRSMPLCFQSAPEYLLPAERTNRRTGPARAWAPVVRSVVTGHRIYWVFPPMVVMWSMTGQWVFAPLFALFITSHARLRTQWLRALPIAPAVVMLACLLPGLIPLVTGAEIGMLLHLQPSRPLVQMGDPDAYRAGTPDVVVSLDFWRHAPGGQAPVIHSPWGETFQPPVHRVLGIALYNPYAVGSTSSQRFFDWQFNRATTAIYGEPVTPQTISRTRAAGLSPITSRPRIQILGVTEITAMFLFWFWLTEFKDWHVLRRVSPKIQGLLVGIPMSLIAVIALLDLRLSEPMRVSHLLGTFLQWAAEILPDSIPLTALICLFIIAAMFAAVVRQSRAADMQLSPEALKQIAS